MFISTYDRGSGRHRRHAPEDTQRYYNHTGWKATLPDHDICPREGAVNTFIEKFLI